VDDPTAGRCVELASSGGTVLLSRELPLAATVGCRVTASCLVRTVDVKRGPQQASTAKLHMAFEGPSGVKHVAARYNGTNEWRRESVTAEVPEGASRVVLNLGLEGCTGRMLVAGLVVCNDRAAVRPLQLASVANAEHTQLDIEAFPRGTVEWQGIRFEVIDAAGNSNGDCLRLAGAGHEDWPRTTVTSIPAVAGATAIYILHGALGSREKSETPCAFWTAEYAGGHEASLSVFQGREIGRIGQTTDLENWHVAWKGQDASGRTVTFGVTKWTLSSDAPLVSLSCRSYRGDPPIILAVTAVEAPPRKVDSSVFDEEAEP
jgi:hypothetical protein